VGAFSASQWGSTQTILTGDYGDAHSLKDRPWEVVQHLRIEAWEQSHL
jgi:hypothetical protein